MILTRKTVKKLLQETIAALSGMPTERVIWEDRPGPRPSDGRYFTLWWKNIEPLVQNSGEYAFHDDGSATQHLCHESYCSVQVSAWGQDAFDAVHEVAQALQADSRWFDLWRLIGYGGVDSVQDISAAFRGQVQGRAYFNLDFYACFGADHPTEWFNVSQWAIRCNEKTEEFEYQKSDRDIPEDCSCLEGEV